MLLPLLISLILQTATGDLVLHNSVTILHDDFWVQTFGGTLRDCAKLCHQASPCLFMQFHESTRACRRYVIGNLLYCSEAEVPGVYTYFKSDTCTLPAFFIPVRQMGRWTDGPHNHLYMATVPKKPIRNFGSQDNSLGFCYAIENPKQCGLVIFGSLNGGKALTRNTTKKGFTPYGYCAPEKGLCKAFTPVYQHRSEFPLGNNLYYPNGVKVDAQGYIRKKVPFCYFWAIHQCGKAKSGNTFMYRVY